MKNYNSCGSSNKRDSRCWLNTIIVVWATLFSCVSIANASSSVSSSDQHFSKHMSHDQLSDASWATVVSKLEREYYQGKRLGDGSYLTTNQRHGLRLRYQLDGTTTIIPLNNNGVNSNVSFRLSSLGYEGELENLTTLPSLSYEGQRLTYDWNELIQEWWVSDKNSVEQWFKVNHRPKRLRDSKAATSDTPLMINMQIDTKMRFAIENNRLVFNETSANNKIIYDHLKVWDANGVVLPASMDAQGTILSLLIDDSQAVYPLTVDPTVSMGDYFKASDIGANDQFGFEVAIDGNTMVVAAPYEDSNATGVNGDDSDNSFFNSGAVYVFVYENNAWTQQAYLKASNPENFDQFGISVDVSGDTIVVGASQEDSNATGINGNQANNSNVDSGAAYVFNRSGSTWTQQAYLKASNNNADDLFGYAVSIDGDTIVVGAYDEDNFIGGINGDETDNTGFGAGAAYVFTRSGSTWSQQAYLKAANPYSTNYFGFDLDISGDTIVVGAWRQSSNTTGVNGDDINRLAIQSGAAYVFVRSGTTWTQQAFLKASNTGSANNFGYSVAVHADTIVVGARSERSDSTGVNSDQTNSGASSSGAAYIFFRSGTTWSQQAYLKSSNSQAGDQFGFEVDVFANTVVVGAIREDSISTGVDGDQTDNSSNLSGAAYVFTRNASNWSQSAYLKAFNTKLNNEFGNGIAIAENIIAVAAHREHSDSTGVNGDLTNSGSSNVGAVFTYGSIAPGDVSSDLALWLKADAGVTLATGVANWADQSGAGNDFSQITTANQPSLLSASDTLNFNPSIQSGGTTQLDGSLAFTGSEYSMIVVASSSAGSNDYIISGTAGGSSPAIISQFGGVPFEGWESPSRFALTPPTINSLHLVSTFHTDATSFDGEIDGLFVSGTTPGFTLAGQSIVRLFDATNDANPFAGNVSEIIIYENNLNSTSEINKINSYLALKYGITLAQSTAQDYTASDGLTEMWNKEAANASTFNNDIFGVGRDDRSELGQIKSKSVNADAIVTLLAEGESSDDSNTPANYTFTDMADLEFLTLGNNDGTAVWTVTGAPNGFAILTRQWSVQQIGDVGTLQLDFDVADAEFDVPDLIFGSSDYYFIFDSDNDGDLSDETPSVLTDQGGDVWRKTAQAFSDGMEFTMATRAYDLGDAPVSYGDARHGASNTLYLGSVRGDIDSSTMNTTSADGDDSGGDDEQTITFQSYQHDGGMTCTASTGSYTTQAGEYCVVVEVNNTSNETAQLVGWLDYDHDDTFNTSERSLSDLGGNGTGSLVGDSSGGLADASFATGNILTGFGGSVVLVFTGLGDNDSQLGISSILRLRLTADSGSDFFTNPSPSTIVADGEVEDHLVAFGVLPVNLSEFSSKRIGNRVRFNWSTASELFNTGFQLWGQDADTGAWRILHNRLIRTKSGNSVEPQSYSRSLLIPTSFGSVKAVGLSTLDNSGEEHYYGPFQLGKHYGSEVKLESIAWDEVREQTDGQMRRLGYEKYHRGYRKITKTDDSSNLASETVIEIEIEQDGLYRITGADLQTSGVDIRRLKRLQTALIDSSGEPVARRMTGRGPGRGANRSIGSKGEIVFYGYAPKGEAALYSNVSVYRIVLDRAKVYREQVQWKQRITSGYSEFYRESVILEEQQNYSVTSYTDDPWVMETVFANRPRTMIKTIELPESVLEDKGYELTLELSRNSSQKAVDNDGDGITDPQHKVQAAVIDVSGTTHLTPAQDEVGLGRWSLRFPLDKGIKLKNEFNEAQVGAIFSAGAGYRSSLVSIDNIGLTYARAYQAKANDDYLTFSPPNDEALGYQVLLPLGSKAAAYVSSGNNLVRIRPESVKKISKSNQRKTQVTLSRLLGADQFNETLVYWVATKDGYLKPSSIREVEVLTPESMLATAATANLLLVAHPAFIGADDQGFDLLTDYMQFKQAQGYTVSLINYLDVVSSFGYGQTGPFGLKRYIDALSEKTVLEYVLLVGGGSYDHLDYLQTGAQTFIPGFYRVTGRTQYTPTDQPFISDGLSIGRWPVRSRSELSAIMAKSKAYSDGLKETAQAVLLAENKDKRHDFTVSLEQLSTLMLPKITSRSVYVDALIKNNGDSSKTESITQARDEFINKVNSGTDAIVYLGHASPDRLMKSNIFNATDAGLLASASPSMWISLACYVTYYESTHVNTLAHQLMFSGNAVNLTGPMYLSSLGDNQAFAATVVSQLSQGSTLGKSIGLAKTKMGSNPLKQNWSLLGDPTIKLVK